MRTGQQAHDGHVRRHAPLASPSTHACRMTPLCPRTQARRLHAAVGHTVFIVESPTKANKIGSFLGADVDVLASYGHFRQLPSKKGAVEPDEGFRMHWAINPKRTDVLERIEAAARKADKVVLATDPDREGEAISWHLAEYLRVRFSVVLAMAAPADIACATPTPPHLATGATYKQVAAHCARITSYTAQHTHLHTQSTRNCRNETAAATRRKRARWAARMPQK